MHGGGERVWLLPSPSSSHQLRFHFAPTPLQPPLLPIDPVPANDRPSKFIVDDVWKTDDSKPSETDSQNVTNNVLPASDITPLPSDATMAGSSKGEAENQSFSVNPIPATAGLGNPVHLAPGDKVPDPSTLTSNTVASTVKLDEASYDKADAAVASQVPAGGDAMSVPPIQKGMIPESSLPMGAGPTDGERRGPSSQSVGAQSTTAQLAGAVPLERAANAQILQSVGADSTTAQLAGAVPLEPAKDVPEVVAESQHAAHVDPEASANAEAVAEKKQVEAELVKKVHEEPAAESSAAAATPQKENVKPEPATATPAADSDKKKGRRRSAFISKFKKLLKGDKE